MKNTLSYTVAMWVIGFVAVAVAGWGADLHASGWLQAFSTMCLGYLMRHIGLMPPGMAQPQQPPAPVSDPTEPPVPPA